MQARSLFVIAGLAAQSACGASPVAPKAPEPQPPAVAEQVAVPPAAPADPLDAPVPLLPEIKTGKLSNGLTYYILKHQKPEQRAQLWLAVNAGSVLEDDDQRGLAHFCEHMAFNGTKRFPKMEIVNFMERSGEKFGADVNAYTSFDETVYQLTVPTDDHAVLMKGLDILRDWAGDVSFEPVEVDKERGVVLEEWRLGRGPFTRINDKQWPVMTQGSKYAERLPIGLPEIIKTANRETLYRFYKDWYRPDNMAVIAVGDFDPQDLEKALKEKFADLTNPAHERARVPVPTPHDQPTAVTIVTDPEMPYTEVQVADKMDHRLQVTKRDFRREIVESLYHDMLRARLSELALDPDAPFTFAASGIGRLTRTGDQFSRYVSAKAGKAGEALAVLDREIARVEKFGFLASELDRARQDQLAYFENNQKEWTKEPDRPIAAEIVRNFFTREDMGGRDLELAMVREILPNVTLDELNHLAKSWSNPRGRVIAISGPASEKLPTEADIRKVVEASASESLEPWKDSGGDRPLMAAKPAPGKVVKTTHDDATDATVWTLSNGVRVIVKPTTFQNDEVRLTGWQSGGTSLLSDAEYDQFRFPGLISGMGVADFDATSLRKVLQGKKLQVQVGIGELGENADANARVGDLETMLQLLNLRLTAPRKDAREFAAWKSQQLEWLTHKDKLPDQHFFEELGPILSSNHRRRQVTTVAMLDKVDIDRALAIYEQRLADFGHFTFVIVGNVDPATLQPLVETYLGSLPSGKRNDHWKDIGVKFPGGKLEKTIVAGTEPKSYVDLTMQAPYKWSPDAARDATILQMALSIRLREVLREDMSGVYFVNASAWVSREPTQRRGFSVFFSCDPANVDKLKAAVFEEVGKVAKAGMTDEYLEKVRAQIKREHEVNVKENGWWLRQLRDAYYFGDDFTKMSDVDAALKRVTSANLQATAKTFFTPNAYVLAVMKPEAAKSGKTAPE